MRRSRGRRLSLAIGACTLALASGAALVFALARPDGLWTVVRACSAAERLVGRPFPCLEADLTKGEALGHVLLRPPWNNDLILSPTRRSVGVEDPFLQTDEAPDYFAQSWRARGLIATADGRPPPRDRIALIVNPGAIRSQEQLHIHIGCLAPWARAVLARAAARSPIGAWRPVGPLFPGRPFWGLKVRSADLAGVEPFRLAWDAFREDLQDPSDLMVGAVGLAEDDAFLIVASPAALDRRLLPAGAEQLLDGRCRDGAKAG